MQEGKETGTESEAESFLGASLYSVCLVHGTGSPRLASGGGGCLLARDQSFPSGGARCEGRHWRVATPATSRQFNIQSGTAMPLESVLPNEAEH